jgi:hypothetical protein
MLPSTGANILATWLLFVSNSQAAISHEAKLSQTIRPYDLLSQVRRVSMDLHIVWVLLHKCGYCYLLISIKVLFMSLIHTPDSGIVGLNKFRDGCSATGHVAPPHHALSTTRRKAPGNEVTDETHRPRVFFGRLTCFSIALSGFKRALQIMPTVWNAVRMPMS